MDRGRRKDEEDSEILKERGPGLVLLLPKPMRHRTTEIPYCKEENKFALGRAETNPSRNEKKTKQVGAFRVRRVDIHSKRNTEGHPSIPKDSRRAVHPSGSSKH